MRAVRFVRTGAPVAVQDCDPPSIEEPEDVIVRIGGAGLCRTDLHILDGAAPLQPPPNPPFTLGHENAGWIEEIGTGVTGLSKGDPVILHPGVSCGRCPACRSGEDMYCPQIRFPGVDGSDGGFAEYLRTGARAVVPLPKGVDPVAAAPLADAGITAYHAVRRLKESVSSDSTVLVIGIGGLGHLGVQLLRALTPGRVFAADARADRLPLAAQYGAESSYLTTDPEFAKQVVRDTHGMGVDAVVDFVGEHDTPDLALKVLRRGGTYSIVGYGGVLRVPTVAMITQEYRILGNFVGTYRDLAELMELAHRGRVSVAARRYPFERAAQAIADLREGSIPGRAILTP